MTISLRLPERGNFSVCLKGEHGEARLCVRGKTVEEAEKRASLCASRQPVAWLDSEGNEAARTPDASARVAWLKLEG